MKTVAFIPVRGGSKSIPQKNIKFFCGKPLVYWSIKAAVDTSGISDVIVATDDDKIEEVVLSFNLERVSVYRRDNANAQDSSSTESVMFEYINKNNLSDDSIFILIQATSPLLRSIDLKSGLNLINEYDSILSCVRSKRFFWTEKGEPINYDYRNRPRRQEYDGILMENGAFYINSISNILKNKNRLSGNIGVVEMPEYTSIEIDEEEDWIIAESLMKRFIINTTNNDFKKIKLFVSDVDGVLTDAGMYYSENGDELKKFNTHDGKAFELLRNKGVKTAIVTSEKTKIVERRAKKLKVDFLFQGKEHNAKLETVKVMCKKLNITLKEVAYIGDDINCFELLSNVGLAACPSNALDKIKSIPNILVLNVKGGEGVVREFVELMKNN